MESPNDATDEEGFDQKPEYETICEQYSAASVLVADKSPTQHLLGTPSMAALVNYGDNDDDDEGDEEEDFAAKSAVEQAIQQSNIVASPDTNNNHINES